MTFFHTHTHSSFSALDALTPVSDLVECAVAFDQPALGLTDHGNMSGAVQLYKACMKHDLLPFIGVEAYLVQSIQDKDAERFHVTLLALDITGYKALVKLTSKSHQRPSYHYKPRIDMADLAHLASTGESEHIALLTGCYFGLLQQTIERTGDEKRARSIVKMFAKWFPNTYIEVQHHNINRGEGQNISGDNEMVDFLGTLAEDLGIPPIITYDPHYMLAKDKPTHDMMKKLIIRDVEPSEAGFPGDTYHFATTSWVKRHYTRNGLEWVWRDAQGSYDELLGLWGLKIPVLDDYRFYVPEIPGVDDAYEAVEWSCRAALDNGPHAGIKRYEDRLRDELGVIKAKDFGGYLMHVAEVTDWMRSQGIIFQARGSASASLVCHLLGITNLDPLKWDLLFERFLDPTRTRPPDIDLDLEDTRREDVIDFVSQQHEVVQIGTYSSLSIRPEDGKGSIVAMYMGYVKRAYPEYVIKTIDDAKHIDHDEYKALWELADIEPRRAPGAHAAGFVIGSPTHPLHEYVPTMLIPSSDRTVTQFTMNDIEDMGYVKDDFLGLRNLTTLRRALELMNHDPSAKAQHCCDGPLEWIAEKDRETMKLMRSGKTAGLFQFEGWASAKTAREMKAKSIKDLSIATALGRPAVMDQGFDELFIERKNNRGEGVTYPGPIFEKHLRETYGIIVFQEQVLLILRDLGMSIEDRNSLLKAVKASNKQALEAEKTFIRLRKEFYSLCKKSGMDQWESDDAWTMVHGFAEYGFNKAHAVQYGITGYRTGYLKTHHPLEYMSALLETTAGTDKEREYIREARGMGLRLLGPSVNDSDVSWTLDRNRKAIRRGLISIKGIGFKAAENIVENAPYSDITDFTERTDSRAVNGGKDHKELKGVCLKLMKAGALSCVGIGRDGI